MKSGTRKRNTKTGLVTSDSADKTVVVTVTRLFRHPLYKKIVRRTNKFMAHDERNDCHTGDRVRIVETRPLSRRKRWRVMEVIARAR